MAMFHLMRERCSEVLLFLFHLAWVYRVHAPVMYYGLCLYFGIRLEINVNVM